MVCVNVNVKSYHALPGFAFQKPGIPSATQGWRGSRRGKGQILTGQLWLTLRKYKIADSGVLSEYKKYPQTARVRSSLVCAAQFQPRLKRWAMRRCPPSILEVPP
ncbi:hypothetical protein RRG08_032406 [Elysia crispata]|uniref:Uncharacterized protein n=1 Tax=Elysia crispata TaxID=231223 RepID=A0AAE0XP06_9GAST|nr:hypothetical protein RRG08_032406 [Elysia crispata]